MLSVLTAASFGAAQSAITVNAKTESAGLPASCDRITPPTDSGGPPGADQIRYDQGYSTNSFYFYDMRARYAVRMDPAYYPAIVAQCDICLFPKSPPHHDSIYVQIWFDRDGDGWPDFPAVWGAWAQGSDSVPDTAAVVVPVPLGQVICDSGSYWVSMMMDTVNGGFEVVWDDSAKNYPLHQYFYYPAGDTWEQDTCGRGGCRLGGYIIRSWTMRQGLRGIVSTIEAPSGRISAGDTVSPEVLLANLGTGADSAWVWMRIEHTCSTDNYIDSCWVRLDPLQTLDTTYRAWSPLYPGIYRMQCTTERNDTNWTYFTVLPRTGLEQGRLPQRLTRNGIEVGPNPVSTEAEIRYSITDKSRVKLRILDTRGRVVRTLVSCRTAAGEHLAVWDARDDHGLPAARGIYFVRLESQDCQETRKVILAR